MPTTATLVVSEQRVSGTAFCNSYDAGLARDGDAFAVTGLARTEIGCEPDVMAAEQAFVTALTAVDDVAVDGGELVLTGPDVELRFTRPASVSDSPLVGTVWRLETLVDGETAASTVAGTLPDLVLLPDGTLRGAAGCGELIGQWTAAGDQVRFAGLPDSSCSGPGGSQHDVVHTVLTAGPRASVDGDRLTLTADGGRALVYRADPQEPARVLGEWVVSELRIGGASVPLPPGAEGTLTLEAGRISGKAFCNGFGGRYRLEEDRLTVAEVAHTLMGCAPDVARAEGLYVRALEAPDARLRPEGADLLVTGDGVEVRLSRP